MTTTRRDLPTRYDAAAVEPGIYERWLESGAFSPAAEPTSGAERFVITMPPPNVTGALHNGHAVFVTLEDLLIRYHRMRGDDTLWVPGVDHASIAAQFVLDKIIGEEGETRASLGRERYLERMWQFMDETRGVIGHQMRRLGASADWSRERFTMDAGSARAVRVAFKRLWDADLAYRGEALVNWCPRCRTTISDLENVKHEESGTLWSIRYHLANADGTPDPDAWITVATTRPETIFGDTAVAVHPEDDRYRALVGREAILPFLGRRLPIIADEHVEREFGTGAVKITPAHDFDDYEVGRRHDLPLINVLDEDARLNDEAGEFAGLDRYEARPLIVERLTAMGDLEGEAPHQMVIGRCDRCGTVVEPRLSIQWFVRAGPLAERALASVRDGRTRIMPAHFEKVYAHWMENIHDWAVGRQLWWGHRIPAWYCPDGHITVSDAEDGPDACATCGRPAAELTQETDIFDTWFSSGLWPFSTLGWPDDTPDYRRFYPTSVMETGYDILFFWVARMMMLGLFLTDAEPFHTVFLHGIVRAEGGVKMGKTKGNVVDPLEVVEEFGADAMRFALVVGTSPGSDQRLTGAKIQGARNFTNKLWNAARFVIGARPEQLAEPDGDAGLAERWIASRLADATARATRQLDELDVSAYAGGMYDFAWSDYCDWFLEMAKLELRREDASDGERSRVWWSAARTLAAMLRLLHPIMPFVTEEIWSQLHALEPRLTDGEPLLISAAWPEAGEPDAAARNAGGRPDRAGAWRAQPPLGGRRARRRMDSRWRSPRPMGRWRVAWTRPFASWSRWRARDRSSCARARPLRPARWRPPAAWAWPGWSVSEANAATAGREAYLQEGIERLEKLLGDARFVERAPAAVVQRERERLEELRTQLTGLTGAGA